MSRGCPRQQFDGARRRCRRLLAHQDAGRIIPIGGARSAQVESVQPRKALGLESLADHLDTGQRAVA